MQKHSLTITFDPTTNAVEVTGPIENKAICYSLLEMARDVVKDYSDTAAKSSIIRAPAGAVPSGNPPLPFPPRHAAGERP